MNAGQEAAGRKLRKIATECEAACDDFEWKSEAGSYNYYACYSHPSTFAGPCEFMLFATNPGGGSEEADLHPAREAMRRKPGFSAYLDTRWGLYSAGCHPIQQSARQVAEAFAGSQLKGDQLLRESPTGNMIPFRSKRHTGKKEVSLPTGLWRIGIGIGQQLLNLAMPRVFIMISSNEPTWNRVLDVYPGAHAYEDRVTKTLPFRWALVGSGDARRFVFALPALNNSQVPYQHRVRVLDLFKKKLLELEVRPRV